jgi:hypothetical protein
VKLDRNHSAGVAVDHLHLDAPETCSRDQCKKLPLDAGSEIRIKGAGDHARPAARIVATEVVDRLDLLDVDR